ncbi:MAG: hypothetical protein ABIP93_10160 [Gemmatimonadaceae bacterium]
MNAIAWQSDRGTPAIAFHALRDSASANAGFASHGQLLFAADARTGSIARIERVDGEWQVTKRISVDAKKRWLTSITLFSGDSLLAVVDLTNRIYLIARDDGRSIASFDPQAPCKILRPQIRGSGHTLLLSGECRLSHGRDTVFGVLFASSDSGRHFTLRHRHPRFAADGSWGSLLGPKNLLTIGASEVSFGDGYSNCIAVFDGRADSLLKRVCGPSPVRYTSPAPAEWQGMRSMQRSLGMRYARAIEWPDPLPLYVDRLASGNRDVWVRLVTPDSVELQIPQRDLLESPKAPLLLGPMDGFRGCDANGCLWLRTRGARSELSFVTGADLERRAVATRTELAH